MLYHLPSKFVPSVVLYKLWLFFVLIQLGTISIFFLSQKKHLKNMSPGGRVNFEGSLAKSTSSPSRSMCQKGQPFLASQRPAQKERLLEVASQLTSLQFFRYLGKRLKNFNENWRRLFPCFQLLRFVAEFAATWNDRRHKIELPRTEAKEISHSKICRWNPPVNRYMIWQITYRSYKP